MFECAEKLSIQDEQVLFQAINLMDRYYTA